MHKGVTSMTASDMVSRDTPPKKAAAPISAKAPGSSHAQNGSVCTPNVATASTPTSLPTSPPINLKWDIN